MAQNEMKAMRGVPLRVPSMEGLGSWLFTARETNDELLTSDRSC